MKRAANVLFFVGLMTISFTLMAEEFSSLEEKMNGREFDQAGLNKLTAEELSALNAWIRENLSAMQQTIQSPVYREVESVKNMPREKIVAKIKGEFAGWRGETIFELDNGQVWEQAESGSFYHKATSPTVIIKPAAFGSWRLNVEGFGRSVRVNRTQ